LDAIKGIGAGVKEEGDSCPRGEGSTEGEIKGEGSSEAPIPRQESGGLVTVTLLGGLLRCSGSNL
jgi:hypothetical protein